MTTLTHLGISCRSLSNALLTFLGSRIPVRVKFFSQSEGTGRERRTRHASNLLGLIISGGQEQRMKDSRGRGGKRRGGGQGGRGKREEKGKGEKKGREGEKKEEKELVVISMETKKMRYDKGDVP